MNSGKSDEKGVGKKPRPARFGVSFSDIFLAVLGFLAVQIIAQWNGAIERFEQRQYTAVQSLLRAAGTYAAVRHPSGVSLSGDVSNAETESDASTAARAAEREFETVYWASISLVVDKQLGMRASDLRQTIQDSAAGSGEDKLKNTLRIQMNELAKIIRCRSEYVKRLPWNTMRSGVFGFPERCDITAESPE